MSGKINMTPGEIQGSLRQILESKTISPLLTPEQRYSLMSALETVELVKILSPGLKKAMEEHRGTKNNSRSNRPSPSQRSGRKAKK